MKILVCSILLILLINCTKEVIYCSDLTDFNRTKIELKQSKRTIITTKYNEKLQIWTITYK